VTPESKLRFAELGGLPEVCSLFRPGTAFLPTGFDALMRKLDALINRGFVSRRKEQPSRMPCDGQYLNWGTCGRIS